MDFMKAFDQVPYRRLLHKVQSYGINGHLLGWITNFLTNRRQRVSVNGSFPSWGAVTSGIPQGSVLGPLLFILFINDLPNDAKSPAYLFADDTKLYRNISNPRDEIILQGDLNVLQSWSDNWLLNFHPDKCKVLTVGKRKLSTRYYLNCRGSLHELDIVHDMKDLGVTIDASLSFEAHIQDKINKANRTTGMIRRAFISLDEDMFLCLFKAFVRPHLEYANAVWNPYKRKDITALENVQRRATKMIPVLNKLSYPERLRKLKLPTLVYRRARGDMIETFKELNSDNKDINPAFTINTNVSRGHNLKILKQRCNKDVRKHFFTYRVANLWNELPSKVVESKNLIAFERHLDAHWKNADFKYDYSAPYPCR